MTADTDHDEHPAIRVDHDDPLARNLPQHVRIEWDTGRAEPISLTYTGEEHRDGWPTITVWTAYLPGDMLAALDQGRARISGVMPANHVIHVLAEHDHGDGDAEFMGED
jgi:hypothetical protein